MAKTTKTARSGSQQSKSPQPAGEANVSPNPVSTELLMVQADSAAKQCDLTNPSRIQTMSEGQLIDLMAQVKRHQIDKTSLLNGLSTYRKLVSDSLTKARQQRGSKGIKAKEGQILDIDGVQFVIKDGVPTLLKESSPPTSKVE